METYRAPRRFFLQNSPRPECVLGFLRSAKENLRFLQSLGFNALQVRVGPSANLRGAFSGSREKERSFGFQEKMNLPPSLLYRSEIGSNGRTRFPMFFSTPTSHDWMLVGQLRPPFALCTLSFQLTFFQRYYWGGIDHFCSMYFSKNARCGKSYQNSVVYVRIYHLEEMSVIEKMQPHYLPFSWTFSRESDIPSNFEVAISPILTRHSTYSDVAWSPTSLAFPVFVPSWEDSFESGTFPSFVTLITLRFHQRDALPL
ncbi:hypothetical protein VNO77_23168 [Canavalia gladiata]|uniref:Uncharacterized protein n=1 Tax=Canavalia gladiata TaxID=3824 RepID=A0AAN9L7A6_CANGL